MRKILLKEAEKYVKQNSRQRVWRKFVRVMACIVVFCTTYALILPAVTLEKEQCGLSEHTHSESCYEKVDPEPIVSLACTYESLGVHVHTSDCYDSDNNLLCGQADYLIHAHNADCVDDSGTIVCQIPEVYAHEHTEACYEVRPAPTVEPAAEDATTETTETQETTEQEIELVCTEPVAQVHVHTEDCFVETEAQDDPLTCTLEENHVHGEGCYDASGALICAEEENHTHSAICYGTWQLVCTLKEHTHDQVCQSDPEENMEPDLEADVETEETWTAAFADIALTGARDVDLLTIARTQLGYQESTQNYEVMEDGQTIKGYTRYGAWYGMPYGDWDAMFISFCLHYARVDAFPTDAYCASWMNKLNAQEIFKVPSEYIPKDGDIIFFDWNGDNNPDHVGIVEDVVGTDVVTIEGDRNNCVERKQYELHDGRIVGYGVLDWSTLPPEDSVEEVIQPGVIAPPEGADAWAVLVGSNGQAVLESPAMTQGESEEHGNANTYSLPPQISTNAVGDPLDLKPYIDNVTMYDENGNVLPSGSTVTEGDHISFKIEFVIDGQQLGVMNSDKTFTIYTDTLTYQLPEIFKVVSSASGNIINSAGQKVGSYEVANTNGKNSTITMVFDNDYVMQNANGIQIQGFISFDSTVTKITDNETENQDYEFKTGLTLGVVVKEHEEAVGSLSIEKQKVSVDGEELVYEVKVTSTEGTNGPITITDTMSPGLTFKEGISVRDGSGKTVNASFDAAADKSSFTMTLPEMAPGESYTVRYKCEADIDLLGADMTARNTASVTGKDSKDQELKDETTVDHTFDVLKKTGTLNEDGTISWSITINQDKMDISGWVLEDILTTAQGATPYKEKVTIQDSRGNTREITLPYTFPNGSKDTYIVTYTTSHDYNDGDEIYNKAILKDDDTDVTVVTGVGIGSPIQKSGSAGELIQDKNGKYLLPITWTVTIDTTNGEIPAGEYLYDKMDGYPSDDMYMTYGQLMAALADIKDELSRVGSNVYRFEAAVFQLGSGHGAVYNYDQLQANVDNCQSFLYERFKVFLGAKIPKGEALTFTYQTYGVFDNNVVVGSRFVNRFNISERYEVEGVVDFTEGSVSATKYAMSYYDPDSDLNQDWIMDWSAVEGTSYFEYEKLHDGYLAWAIGLSVPMDYWGSGNLLLYEDLPEGVTVKGLDFSFLQDVPTSRLELQDMVPGQTYKLEFTLYPADQYGHWDPQGGQLVAIEVKLTENGDLEISMPGIIFETMAQYGVYENQEKDEEDKHVEWWVFLYIYTQINEDFAWTPEEEGSFDYVNIFENKFTLYNENGDVIDVGSQAQEIKKEESKDTVRKQASTDNNNIITYSVVLNAYGRDLIENVETLSVHDELTYSSTDANSLRLRLVPGSVKLYEIDMASDGSYTKGNEVTALYSYNESASRTGDTTTWVHTLDLNVPDGKALLLEYSYRATGTLQSQHDVINTCTLNGVGEGGLHGDNMLELEVKQSSAQADTKGVMIFKVDANSDGIFLKDAKFNIYIWNQTKKEYVLVNNLKDGGVTFATDPSGKILLDGSTMGENQFAYNTAYYLVEVESPNGYYLSPEPYYFQIVHEDTAKYPSCLPDNFVGHNLTSGDIIYRKNVSSTTEISVEKYWLDYAGKSVTITGEKVSSVTLELWQQVEGDPDSGKLYGTYTMTPDQDGNWRLTIKGLPKGTQKADGTKGVTYLYYIKEVAVNGYALESSENNEGINSGTIKLVNREQEGYILPETGGAGTTTYTMAGLLLIILGTAYLMYRPTARRREEY